MNECDAMVQFNLAVVRFRMGIDKIMDEIICCKCFFFPPFVANMCNKECKHFISVASVRGGI